MKKHLIAIAILLFAFQISNAQTEKGMQNLGLNVGYSYLKIDNKPSASLSSVTSQKNTSFNIGPDYSYFIADNLDLGVALNYNKVNQESISSNGFAQDGYSYGIGVYLRKYFLYNGKIGLRTAGQVFYSHGDTKYTNAAPNNIYNYESKDNSYSAGAHLELIAYPAKKLGISASLAGLSYAHTRQNEGTMGTVDINSFNFSTISDGLSLSVFYVFGKK